MTNVLDRLIDVVELMLPPTGLVKVVEPFDRDAVVVAVVPEPVALVLAELGVPVWSCDEVAPPSWTNVWLPGENPSKPAPPRRPAMSLSDNA